jgi:hypothetical protein
MTLANLLPGLRDLRTPLAAGYLWLLTAWLLVEPSLPERDEASGVLQSILRIGEVLGPIASAVALSFVAYLVGVLSLGLGQVVTMGLTLRRIGRARRHIRPSRENIAEVRAQFEAATARSRNFTVTGASRQMVEVRVKDRVREESQKLKTVGAMLTLTDIDSIFDDRSVPLRAGLPVDKADLGAERLLPTDVGRSGWRRILAAVSAQALREFDLLPTRLMGDSPEIFAEVDKTRAEAEFRLGIVPPLLALVLVGCIKVSWFWAFAFPALGLLLVTGLIKRREAGDQLAQAIQLGKVDPPVLEKLRSLVQEKVDEAKTHREG